MNTMMRLTAVAATLVGTSLMAQESIGTVVGSVKSEKGAAIEGARLTLTSPALLGGRTLSTDDKGNFRLPLLPPGDYVLTVSKANFVGSTATFRIGAGQTLRQDMKMREMATASIEVEVVASAAQVDKTDTKTATVMGATQLQNLPVNVSAQSALFLSPGVTGSTDYPSIRGGVGGASQFTINGISVRDNATRYGRQTAYVLTDLTEDIQVIQSPLNAKYGNSSGGTVNLTTKSGSNDWQGSFRISMSRNSWNAYNSPQTFRRYDNVNKTTASRAEYLSPSTASTDDLSRTYQFTVLGPIIKDKLTFSYGRTWSPTTTTTANLTNVLGAGVGYYLPNLTGTTASAQAGYTWGVTDAAQNRVITGTGGKDLVQQAKLFYMVSQDHQVEAFYTRDDYGPNFDPSNSNTMEDVSQRQQKSLRTFMGINYRGIIQGGVLDVKVGQTKKTINFPSGFGEPIYVRSWIPNAASILANTSGASSLYLTNGDAANPNEELRQNNNISANYFWTNGEHNIDVGAEQLKETYLGYESAGANRRRFYVPGRAANGNYAVYNWFAGPFTDPAIIGAAKYNAITAFGSGFVPEMATYSESGSGDLKDKDTTNSLYVNDQWMINANWSLMAGLRYDNWKVQNRVGTEVNTHGFSPRVEVKYDLNGDNRHLVSLSYAHLRGTIGQGNLGTYARRPGNLITRHFWNEGAGAIHLVDQAALFNTANYASFQRMNLDAGKEINPNLRPEMAKQLELTYRRGFEKGGFFRTALVYRKYVDLWYRHGIDELVQDGATVTTRNMLDFDPANNRSYKGLELEWNLPLYRSANSSVDLNGFWTSGRSLGRVTWSDGGASTAIRFDKEYQAAGYSIDRYNAYGEYANSVHNNVKMWLSWTYGTPGRIQSSLSLLGNYQTGAPYSNTFSEYLPGLTTGDTRPMAINTYTKDTPTSIAYFMGPRGQFIGPDTYYVDLKWNLTFPVAKKVKLFTELTIGNLFNHLIPANTSNGTAGINRPASTVIRGGGAAGSTFDRTYNIQNTDAAYSSYGLVYNYAFGRSFSFDCGIRF